MESTFLPKLITTAEFIEEINKNTTSPIGVNTIYKLIQQPGFPSVKIGERNYIMIDQFSDWMTKQAANRFTPAPCEVNLDAK